MTEKCIPWPGRCDPDGYGRLAGKLAHRLMFEKINGPIPEGMEVDHLCKTRNCINPEHLEVVTHRENWLRSGAVTVSHLQKSHCLHGHLFDTDNTYYRSGRRSCRACNNRRVREYKARQKELV